MREPAVFEQRQPEIGVLDDGLARPAADGLDGGAPDQAHRAVHDDGVEFVPLHHADIEEAGIFGVHRLVHHRAVAVAMILRRLHEPNARIGEQRHQILEPVGVHDIIGVDHADDLGVRRGMFERDAQRAGLVALVIFEARNLKRSPSVRQCSSTGRQNAGSGVLLMITTHSTLG